MVEKAVAIRQPPAISIDLTKASPKILRHLRKEKDKDRTLALVEKGLEIVKPIITHEITLLLAGIAVGNWMLSRYENAGPEGPKFPYLEPYEANFIGWGMLGIALAKSGTIADVGKAVGDIKGAV